MQTKTFVLLLRLE